MDYITRLLTNAGYNGDEIDALVCGMDVDEITRDWR